MAVQDITASAEERRPKSPREATWWLVVRDDPPDVYIVDGRKTLPVFGFREEAEMFLRFEAGGDGWRLQEVTASALHLVLLGICGSAERVALDPPPRAVADGVIDLISQSWRRFEGFLVDRALDNDPAAARSPVAEKQT